MNKVIPVFVALLLFSSIASATCSISINKGKIRDTSGMPIDLYSFNQDEYVLIGNTITRQTVNDRVVLDLFLVDSLNNTVGTAKNTYLANDTYFEANLTITGDFLNSTYSILSYSREYDVNGTLLCSASKTASIFINSPRTSWNSTKLDINTTVTSPLTHLSECKTIVQSGVSFDVCMNGEMPLNYTFQLGNFNSSPSSGSTNYSVLITPGTPKYDYGILKGLLDAYENSTSSVSTLTGVVSQQNQTITQLASIATNEENRKYSDLFGLYNTLLGTTLPAEKNSSMWAGIFIGLVPGMITGVLLLLAVLWVRSKQTEV